MERVVTSTVGVCSSGSIGEVTRQPKAKTGKAVVVLTVQFQSELRAGTVGAPHKLAQCLEKEIKCVN